jgi:transcriptional regulator with XRE-family HTH domain
MLDEIWKEANIFHNVLQSFRVRRGKSWTQEATAELLHVKPRKYIGWENGESIPAREELEKIVAVFRLSQEEAETLYHAAWQAPPRICLLPFSRNPFFTGRNTYMEQLRQYLQEHGSAVLTQPVSISGLPGIGKSQLALEYAYRCFPKVYRAVFWVNAADRKTLQADYYSLAHRLKLPDLDEHNPEQCKQAVKQWLVDHTNWLLIMDNADNLQLARSFFPEGHQGHILLTTRSQFAGKIGARQIDIDKMEQKEGLRFLLRRSGKLQDESKLDDVPSHIRATALQLVELLGGLPLALDQAGAFINETGVSLADYLKLYQTERLSLLAMRDADGSADEHPELVEHPESVVATVRLCRTKAFERQPRAAVVLYICAFFTTETIPEELFQYIPIEGEDNLDANSLNEAVTVLRRFSLIKRNAQNKTLSMHRLVQVVLTDMLAPELRRKLSFIINDAVLAMKPQSDLNKVDALNRQSFYIDHVVGHYHVYLEDAEDYLNTFAWERWWHGSLSPGVEMLRLDFAAFLRRLGRHAEAAALEADDLEPARKFVFNELKKPPA